MKKNVLLALALVGSMLSAQAHDQRGGWMLSSEERGD